MELKHAQHIRFMHTEVKFEKRERKKNTSTDCEREARKKEEKKERDIDTERESLNGT